VSNSCKPHHPPQCDQCWHAIQRDNCDNSPLTLADLRFVHKLGSGDIGSVYLVELKEGNGCLFAAKVMDKKEMATRNKDSRARIEREILEMLEHPFLPTLYATLDSPRWSCLLTEFCPGGDLHVLRQQQPDRRFGEAAIRYVHTHTHIHTYNCTYNVRTRTSIKLMSYNLMSGCVCIKETNS
jgi:serine/threonine protein kinase